MLIRDDISESVISIDILFCVLVLSHLQYNEDIPFNPQTNVYATISSVAAGETNRKIIHNNCIVLMNQRLLMLNFSQVYIIETLIHFLVYTYEADI